MSTSGSVTRYGREVLTVGNTHLRDQAADFARSRAAVRMPGTCLPVGVMAPLACNTDVFAIAQPSTLKAMVAVVRTIPNNYQDKTRITAAGGSESGSHPAWDPV
jgi:hypothetical protein